MNLKLLCFEACMSITMQKGPSVIHAIVSDPSEMCYETLATTTPSCRNSRPLDGTQGRSLHIGGGGRNFRGEMSSSCFATTKQQSAKTIN